jgi:hypothetical protein
MRRGVVMTAKFKFAPYAEPAEATEENLEKLNRLRSLYYAHLDSGLPVKEFAEEFFRTMGKILMGSPLEHLDLTHVEFERDSLDDDDSDEGYTFVLVVVSFEPEEGPF